MFQVQTNCGKSYLKSKYSDIDITSPIEREDCCCETSKALEVIQLALSLRRLEQALKYEAGTRGSDPDRHR